MGTGARQAPGAFFTVVVKKSILGAKVINTAQEDLGKIEDLVIDARNSRVAYAILSFGGVLGLGDKHFAIPWEALTFDLSQKVAVLDMDKDRLKNAPGFDKDDWPDLANQTWAPRCMTTTGFDRIGRREKRRRGGSGPPRPQVNSGRGRPEWDLSYRVFGSRVLHAAASMGSVDDITCLN